MIMFTTSDGLIFEAKTHQAVVRKMARLNWHRNEPKRRYMEDVIDRVEQMTNESYRSLFYKINAHDFLLFLEHVELGVLRVID